MNDPREAKAAAARARMAELAQRFVARTRDELVAVRAALAGVDAGDTGGYATIRHFAHRVCGTAGTLGFMELSDLAGDLERMLDRQMAAAAPDASVPVRVASAVEALEAQLNRLGTPAPG